jgi:hypothetical protein
VAIDLPAFGRSQRRDALPSPRATGGFVIRVTDAFGLEIPKVIGPDVGTGPRCSPPRRIRADHAAWWSAVAGHRRDVYPARDSRPPRRRRR